MRWSIVQIDKDRETPASHLRPVRRPEDFLYTKRPPGLCDFGRKRTRSVAAASTRGHEALQPGVPKLQQCPVFTLSADIISRILSTVLPASFDHPNHWAPSIGVQYLGAGYSRRERKKMS
jgi:hypothetical protein